MILTNESQMTLLTILLLATITFLTRYLLLHPKFPIKIGNKMESFLSFSAPAVLTAIWIPIVFIHDHQLDITPSNPYLIGAIIAVIIAKLTSNVYITLSVSSIFFSLVKLYIA